MKKQHGIHIESFGERSHLGDVIGCFLDADRRCLSKKLVVSDRVVEFVIKTAPGISIANLESLAY